MAGAYLIDGLSTQDRDLLTRLTQYFDTLETRLAQGQGWLIFNARGTRASWLGRFIPARLREYRPLVSSFVMPWRDFALNAYVTEVELPARSGEQAVPAGRATSGTSAEATDDTRVEREYQLAAGVSRATGWQMRQCDVLVVLDVRPTHRHEVSLLDHTLETRYSRRRPTILLTSRSPHDLATELAMIEGGAAAWERLWSCMYERSLIAL